MAIRDDGHLIDDPCDITNAKIDFDRLGKFIIPERNCIIIDGHTYVLRDAERKDCTICEQCALYKTCKAMIEWPLCDMLHHTGTDGRKIYVEKSYDERNNKSNYT